MEADGGLLDAGTRPVKALANHGTTLGRPRITAPDPVRAANPQMGQMVGPDDKPIDESNPPAREVSPEAMAEAAALVKAQQQDQPTKKNGK